LVLRAWPEGLTKTRDDRFTVLQRGEVIAAGSKAELPESQLRDAVSV
jgi:hypothetical protein